MGTRRKSRECALQILYLYDITNLSLDEIETSFWGSLKNTPTKIKEFAQQLVRGTIQNREKIDAIISKYAENWEINRMVTTDRNILRQASFELISLLDIPVKVIINEAVDIAKKFGTQESGRFVNGILDKIKEERETAKNKKER